MRLPFSHKYCIHNYECNTCEHNRQDDKLSPSSIAQPALYLEVAERLHAVEVLDLDSGALHSLTPAECDFGYRDSVFKHALAGKSVITRVRLRLPRPWKPVGSVSAGR